MVEIVLSNNNIKSISANQLRKLRNLNTAIFYNNRIKRLEKGWTNGLRKLETLDLNDNQLSTLSNDVFDGLQNLVSLSLCYNKFRFTDKLNAPFSSLKRLQNLDLTGNNLASTIGPNSFKDLNNLKLLWLRDSNIKSLNIDAFKLPFCSPKPSKTEIRIANNPIVQTNRSILRDTKCYSFILND